MAVYVWWRQSHKNSLLVHAVDCFKRKLLISGSGLWPFTEVAVQTVVCWNTYTWENLRFLFFSPFFVWKLTLLSLYPWHPISRFQCHAHQFAVRYARKVSFSGSCWLLGLRETLIVGIGQSVGVCLWLSLWLETVFSRNNEAETVPDTDFTWKKSSESADVSRPLQPFTPCLLCDNGDDGRFYCC